MLRLEQEGLFVLGICLLILVIGALVLIAREMKK